MKFKKIKQKIQQSIYKPHKGRISSTISELKEIDSLLSKGIDDVFGTESKDSSKKEKDKEDSSDDKK